MAGTDPVLVRANHPDTDGPDWFYAGWGEVFDARPQAEDESPLEELIRTLPGLLDRLAAVPNFLLWIETDRLLPPWDVQQDVFQAYMDDDISDDEPEPAAESDTEEDEAEDDEPEHASESEDDAGGEEEEGIEEEGDEDEEAVPPEPERVQIEPLANPETGPFDRTDLDAWDWLHKTFAAVVTKLDAELGAVFDLLRDRGLAESAAWVVTSDFGFPLGEHGQLGVHRPWLHEELVHLPLILRLPNAEHAGRRVPGFTQPPDLYPTLCSLVGVAAPDGAKRFDLLPLARGEAESSRAIACTHLETETAAEMAIRTADSVLLVPLKVPDGDPPRGPQLYEKPDDRWEVNDLYARHVERADELEALLRQALGR